MTGHVEQLDGEQFALCDEAGNIRAFVRIGELVSVVVPDLDGLPLAAVTVAPMAETLMALLVDRDGTPRQSVLLLRGAEPLVGTYHSAAPPAAAAEPTGPERAAIGGLFSNPN